MEKWGKSILIKLANDVESDVATSAEKNTYRYYDGVTTPLTSYKQLAVAMARYRNYGAAPYGTKAILSDMIIPDIIDSGLAQFAPERANEDAYEWELARFAQADWFKSNLLTVHNSGDVGNAVSNIVTVNSVVRNAANQIIALNVHHASIDSDPTAFLANDKFTVMDGTSNLPNTRYLTFTGYTASAQQVQCRITADAATDGSGNATISIFPPLQVAAGSEQNISQDILPGMRLQVLPTHRCGLIFGGKSLFFASPQLPDEIPYPTARTLDPETGIHLRTYYGALFGQNSHGIVHDLIYGYRLVDEYAYMLALPV
jgi:hypothetical protein